MKCTKKELLEYIAGLNETQYEEYTKKEDGKADEDKSSAKEL
jgi:hypothetical protein